MTSEEAAMIARDAHVETLLLTHLPHFGNVEQLADEAKTIFHGDVHIAKTRWIWEG